MLFINISRSTQVVFNDSQRTLCIVRTRISTACPCQDDQWEPESFPALEIEFQCGLILPARINYVSVYWYTERGNVQFSNVSFI